MEQDKEILKIIADNPLLQVAVRKILEKQFEIDIPLSDAGLEDIVLGQMTRARLVGLRKIDNAFKEIERFKSFPAVDKGPNPAR